MDPYKELGILLRHKKKLNPLTAPTIKHHPKG